MAHYFNEFDPYAAEWLRRLMRAGLIPEGEVDERPIQEVRSTDLRGFVQCHFFAGIGGWSEALRLAGWPDGRPVWTGSCPCQPFSSAGKRKAQADDRHLWPHFFRLIRECRPECVIGEQVEGAIGHGWLDGVQTDLEGEGYAIGSAVLGAHSVGADHKRQRLYWVADAGHSRRRVVGETDDAAREMEEPGRVQFWSCDPDRRRSHGPVAYADGGESSDRGVQRGGQHGLKSQDSGTGVVVGDTDEGGRTEGDAVPRRTTTGVVLPVPSRVVGVAHDARSQGRGVSGRERAGELPLGASGGSGFWDACDLILCRDGKVRRIPQGGVESGLFPLAHGVSGRVAVSRPGEQTVAPHEEGEDVRWVNRAGALRGAGNAIVPQVAAEFIAAFLDVEREHLR